MMIFGWIIFAFVSVYFLLMLIALSGFFKKQKLSGSSSLFVSVIVPCRNEENNLHLLSESLLKQNYPHYEIIFVDDRSTDKTSEILTELQKKKSGKISVLKTTTEKNGKKHALLAGIENAKGEIILTTDADCVHSEKWISGIASAFADEKIKMIVGSVILKKTDSFFANIQQSDQTVLTAISAGFINAGLPVMCSGANLAFRKSAFFESGNYASHINDKSGDDVFLLHAFVKKYGKDSVVALTDRETTVKTNPVKSVAMFLQQRLRWGEKSKRYTLFFPVFLALVTALTSMLLLAGLLLLPLYHAHFTLLSISLGTKAAIDFLLLFLTGRVLGSVVWPWYFIPAFLFHLFYVPVISGAAIFSRKVKWK